MFCIHPLLQDSWVQGLVFLGNISFSFYLFHQPIMIRSSQLGGLLRGFQLFSSYIFVFLWTLAISMFSFAFLERPLRSFLANRTPCRFPEALTGSRNMVWARPDSPIQFYLCLGLTIFGLHLSTFIHKVCALAARALCACSALMFLASFFCGRPVLSINSTLFRLSLPTMTLLALTIQQLNLAYFGRPADPASQVAFYLWDVRRGDRSCFRQDQ